MEVEVVAPGPSAADVPRARDRVRAGRTTAGAATAGTIRQGRVDGESPVRDAGVVFSPLRRILVVALVALVTVGCAHVRHFTERDRADVAAVLDAQAAAWNRGDLDGYMAGYARTDELVFTSGGNVQRGFDDALAHYRARYGGDRASMGHLTFEILGVQAVGADGAVVLGHWELTGTAHAGRGVFTLVLERRPEGWRIIHDHTSVSPEAASPS